MARVVSMLYCFDILGVLPIGYGYSGRYVPRNRIGASVCTTRRQCSSGSDSTGGGVAVSPLTCGPGVGALPVMGCATPHVLSAVTTPVNNVPSTSFRTCRAGANHGNSSHLASVKSKLLTNCSP